MLELILNAVIGLVLVSISSAIIGTYVVTRRMVFICGGITHTCFGGLGLGYFLGWSPLGMAALFAVGGSLGVERLAKRGVRRDSAIAVIWALGMALGILFIFLTPGFVPELNTFLFGNVLTITRADLWAFLIFTILLGGFFVICRPLVEAVSFDEDFARTRHLPVGKVNFIMTVFTALGIVLTIRLVGIMLLMSMMSLPVMTSECFGRSYGSLMLGAMLITLIGSLAGLAMAYAISVPASASIVLLLAIFYIAANGISKIRKREKGNGNKEPGN